MIQNMLLSITFRYHDEEFGNILNSLYLVAVTFLCVGYGDIVANTYCEIVKSCSWNTAYLVCGGWE